MKLLPVLIPIATLIAGFFYTTTAPIAHHKAREVFPVAERDTSEFNQEKALEELRERIKGREDEPAGDVFENIENFKQMPAARLLRVMEMGFSRSLGVNCTHCHNPDDWASEEKPQKQIARDMMAMAGTINTELLSKIENLESERPTVNCTTCHRGQVKPALNLDE